LPVPRRFDRQPPERDTTRINERIRVPEVRLIGDDGEQIGILKTPDAMRYAQERDLDLVEVAPEAKPPVCRVLDYSKYKYEQAQKQKQARKHQQQITIREIKFRPKIAQHDYDTKKGHVERFLKARDKVKVTIMFRGREVAHPERGEIILNRLAEELGELAVVEQRPTQDGRNMTMMLAPTRSKADDAPSGAAPAGASAGPGPGKDSRRSREQAAAATPEPAPKAKKQAAEEPPPEPEPAEEPVAEVAPEPEAEEPKAEEPEAEEPKAEEPEAKPAPKKRAPAKPKAAKAPAKAK
jgi:translation initiation factor IF-3